MSEFFVVFSLDHQRYALPIAVVERIVCAVEVTTLPDAPANVIGAIDVGGRVVPVFNLRRRFGLPQREVRITDHFVLARTAERTVALVIDEPHGVEPEHAGVVDSAQIVAGLDQLKGVLQLADGLVLIQDLDQFLSLDEARMLDGAISRMPA